MKYSRESMVQRPFNFAVVDEVDSILVDEARTPLIISGPTEDKTDLYLAVDAVVKVLPKDAYDVDETQKSIMLTEDGTEAAERAPKPAGLLVGAHRPAFKNPQVVPPPNQHR